MSLTWKQVANWAVILGGVLLVAWGAWIMVAPQPVCRGVVMQPGDVCHYASPTDAHTNRIQTFEERVAAARQSGPALMGTGVLISGFGLVLGRGLKPTE